MSKMIQQIMVGRSGQDIAEYAVMLAVILVLVVGTVRLIGSNANNAFSQLPARFSSERRTSDEVLPPTGARVRFGPS